MSNLLTHLILWLPLAVGALFAPVVQLDQHLYRTGRIGVQGAAGIELLYLLITATAFLTSAATGIQIFKEQRTLWGIACATVAILLGLVLLGAGFRQGAALLYAT